MHYVYYNGYVQPVSQTAVGLTDLGLLRGYGLFDYFRTYNGRPFQWDLYWNRIVNSATQMRLPLPILKEEVYDVILDLRERSGLADIAVRVLLTGGYSADSINMEQPNLFIISEDIKKVAETDYEQGIRVILNDYVREMAEVKSTDYKHVIRLAHDLREAGAQDVLYHRNGEISELSRSNFFLVRGNRLITSDRHILHGITRQTVLDLAQDDFQIEVRPVQLSELANADEAFTTSSIKIVLPVVAVDGQPIGNGTPGPNSKLLLERFRQLIAQW